MLRTALERRGWRQRVQPQPSAGHELALARCARAELDHAPGSLPGLEALGAHGHCRVVSTVVAVEPGSALDRFARMPAGELTRGLRGLAWRKPSPLAAESPIAANGLAFLDLETTGPSRASGTLAWLVGLGRIERRPDGLVVLRVEQWLARSPSEEEAVVAAARDRLAQCDAVVTFNGASFDLPLLDVRWVMHRLRAPETAPHLDLLPVARRAFGALLPDVRLATLGEQLLGLERGDEDLPGSLAPFAFREHLRTGNTALLRGVLHHNAADIVALARLLAALSLLALEGPGPGLPDCDPLALAAWQFAAGRPEAAALHAVAALQTSRHAHERGRPMATRRLVLTARMLTRCGAVAPAVQAWAAVARRADASLSVLLELSRVLERAAAGVSQARSGILTVLARADLTAAARARVARGLARLDAHAASCSRAGTARRLPRPEHCM